MPGQSRDEVSAIVNARIFDGKRLIEDTTLVMKAAYIQAVGGEVPTGATIVDAHGAMLMGGLIDSHVHTDRDGLREALGFGVTTEPEMMGHWSRRKRNAIGERHDVADVRSPGMGVTPPGGHPTQYVGMSDNFLLRHFFRFPSVSTPDEAATFVAKQVAGGADYIKKHGWIPGPSGAR